MEIYLVYNANHPNALHAVEVFLFRDRAEARCKELNHWPEEGRGMFYPWNYRVLNVQV